VTAFLLLKMPQSKLTSLPGPVSSRQFSAGLVLSSLTAKFAGQVCQPSLPTKSTGQVCRPCLPAKSDQILASLMPTTTKQFVNPAVYFVCSRVKINHVLPLHNKREKHILNIIVYALNNLACSTLWCCSLLVLQARFLCYLFPQWVT
jgi:hypothetical protein